MTPGVTEPRGCPETLVGRAVGKKMCAIHYFHANERKDQNGALEIDQPSGFMMVAAMNACPYSFTSDRTANAARSPGMLAARQPATDSVLGKPTLIHV